MLRLRNWQRGQRFLTDSCLRQPRLDLNKSTAENRVAGDGDAERAALHKSMLAYTGRYRVEGSELVTTVDTSWNEAWNGTEQRRRFKLEGTRLIIESAPALSIVFPGKIDVRRIVWEKEAGCNTNDRD